MAVYYSASTRGFYDTDFAACALPSDAKEITRDQYNALLAAQSSGQAINPDANGRPVASVPAFDTAAALKAQAQELLSVSDIQVVRCCEVGLAFPDTWKQYRAALRDIVTSGAGAIPVRPAWPN
jgi:hypothetical protein